MDRGTWWVTDHRVAKSRTCLKQLSMHGHESFKAASLPASLTISLGSVPSSGPPRRRLAMPEVHLATSSAEGVCGDHSLVEDGNVGGVLSKA